MQERACGTSRPYFIINNQSIFDILYICAGETNSSTPARTHAGVCIIGTCSSDMNLLLSAFVARTCSCGHDTPRICLRQTLGPYGRLAAVSLLLKHRQDVDCDTFAKVGSVYLEAIERVDGAGENVARRLRAALCGPACRIDDVSSHGA